MTNKLKSELKSINPLNFLILFIAGFINAFGVTVFLTPVGLYDSAISGTSFLLSQITPSFFTLSFFLLLLNIPLFLIGYKRQGLKFTIYAIFSVASYSLWAYLITYVLPIDVTIESPMAKTDLVLCSIFGGAISGMGSGLAIRFGGAMDGIEVLAVIFAKKLNLTVGTFVMIYNVVLYIIAGLVFGSFIIPLYSIISYAIALKTVDFIVEGIDRAKGVFIITTKGEAICQELSNTFKCGLTVMHVEGYYSHQNQEMIYVVINRFQINKAKEVVHQCDPLAYITINDVADVFKGSQKSQNLKPNDKVVEIDNSKETENTLIQEN